MMRSLLEWLDEHHDQLDATRFVCMNLSGGSLNDERFIGDAFAMLAEHRRSAQRLCIEVTEGVALSDLGNTKKFIDRVRDYGTRIALDDFGAGYTSFSYLRHLPADVVKIDGGFVRDAHLSPMNLGIVATIADLARNLGMKTIAEWSESLESVRAMAEVGIDYVQGFAISRPVLPDEILARRSCADFVSDPDTRQFLEMLGNASSPEVARIADAKAKRGLH
ncbi:MAG: EAL domain-containing protein [Rhodocyclaceae bacterium]|nr:EAL domain-containing protein [Rhodocyclaceae bacterium]